MYHSVHAQRYGKAKGMKVKHLVQLVALTVLFTWFLYQLNSSHKAKVLSRRAEKEDDIDDELLITAENLDSGLRVGYRVDHDEGTEIAHEDFIDMKSVFKSRKELQPVDRQELEQTAAEGVRVDDILDDSGEGDGDDIVNSEDSVRRTEDAEIELKGKEVGGIDYESLRGKAIEISEDRGDGEDEAAENIDKEVRVLKGWTTANPIETVEDDAIEDTNEEIEMRNLDLQEDKSKKILPATAASDLPDVKTELVGSESSRKIPVSKILEVEENLSMEDDGRADHLKVSNETKKESAIEDVLEAADKNRRDSKSVTSPSFEVPEESELNFKMLGRRGGHDKESNVSGKVSTRFSEDSSDEASAGPIPSMESGLDSDTKDPHGKLLADANSDVKIVLGGSESSRTIPISKILEVGENLSIEDVVGTDHLKVSNETKKRSAIEDVTEAADKNHMEALSSDVPAETKLSLKLLRRRDAHGKEFNVTKNVSSRFSEDLSEEASEGPIPSMESGLDSDTQDPHVKLLADTKPGQENGGGHILRTSSSLDNKAVTSAEDGQRFS